VYDMTMKHRLGKKLAKPPVKKKPKPRYVPDNFKEVFEEGVAEGVNNKNPLRDMIKTERVPFRGREIVRLSHTARNVSPMFVGEDSEFADAGNQAYSRLFVDQRKLMW